ncbi:STAS domain-containing protein [Mesobacillus harenae]|uniref:STAS domain-containing protein n=1 Tax=Mesobacillus harenae TaxID=2213203 RepID=UPI00157FE52F|nr:STAS domain-containing protein [Mesobacillus harenae]
MKDELRYIGEKIFNNHAKLAGILEEILDSNYTERLNKSGMTLEKRTEYRSEIFQYFGEALYGDLDLITQKVTEWGEKAANLAIRHNQSLSDSLRATSFYRTVIWDVFQEELDQRQFAAITMLDVSKIVDPLLDKVNRTFGEVYEKHNNRLMTIAYSALENLSVPVVPIAKGLAVIPLVGEIDTHRAKLIMEVSLQQGSLLNLNYLIFDVSGVPMIDTMVADQIFQIVKAVRLTGIEAILTGIRPEIAQTIVSLGLNFGDIQTRANMQQALSELGFRQMGQQVLT